MTKKYKNQTFKNKSTKKKTWSLFCVDQHLLSMAPAPKCG